MTEPRKGEWLIFSNAILWAFFPVITALTYRSIGGAVSLLLSTVITLLFFTAVMFYRRKWRELKNALLWKYGLLTAIFIGVLYYSLIFIGLETTSPGNVAILLLCEVLTSFLLFNVYKKEAFPSEYIVGAILMVMGAGIILVRDFSGINMGDLFVLAATFFAPIGNVYQQKARTIASSESIMFLRVLLTIPALAVLAYFLGAPTSLADLRASLPFLLINGILVLGLSKILWIEAIHRISVTKGVALGSIAPFLTLIIAWAILKQVPSVWQIVSLVPLTLGVLLLTDNLKRTHLSYRQ